MAGQTPHELVTALYEGGVPVVEIAQRAGVCEILARYVAGDPVAAIAADNGVRQARVRAVAVRAGVPPRTGWQRLYPLDERAFDTPTDIGWWLIGLLAADGCIHDREYRVSLSQTLDDADVLHAFYEYVGCPGRPLTMLNLSAAARRRQLSRRPAAEARIFSKRIVEALGRHGVVARKSATLELGPEAAWQPAVWLGLLDGDGSVGIYRDGTLPRVRFSGTQRLMEQCEAFWRQTLPYDGSRPAATPHRKGLWQFSLCRLKASGAAKVLLASSERSLIRKRALLADIAAWEPDGVLCRDH